MDTDTLKIRRAEEKDMPEIIKIYRAAALYMAENGNRNQWVNGYPREELVRSDMAGGNLYVCEENEKILAAFAFFVGTEDPNYTYIEGGAWKNDEEYGVIHRIAVSEDAHGRGIGLFCLNDCYERFPNLRIDTHRDNIPMQNVIKKAGFDYCGVVYMEDGSQRLAFMKTKKGTKKDD